MHHVVKPHEPRAQRPSGSWLAGLSLLLAACGGTTSTMTAKSDAEVTAEGDSAVPRDASTPADSGGSIDLSSPRSAANLFLSGHSLTDNPLPDNLEEIAKSLSGSLKWNQQNVIGSPLRIRTRGNSDSGWTGYSQGKNREGSNMNVLNELRNPQTVGGARYDTLLITERHDMLGAIFYEDTIRYLRHYHERFIEGNAQGLSYFYESWLGVPDKSRPESWISYERAALPVWECVVTRINRSLEAEGRSDRITTLPAGAALAELVDRAVAGGVDGISGGSAQDVVNRLFRDDVHLTNVGVYYMALVSYAAVYRKSPVGAWNPSEVSAAQAASLQRVAWDYVANYYAQSTPRTLTQCQELMRSSGCSAYWTFREQTGNISACVGSFGKQERENPFWFDAASDASYWFPAP